MKAFALLALLAVAVSACGGSSSSGGSKRGDAVAGKRVFLSAGCGRCHSLKAAGTRGLLGGPLDGASLQHDFVLARVRAGGGGMPSYANKLSESQIENLVAFVVAATKR
jgi:sulfite dehydrogenase